VTHHLVDVLQQDASKMLCQNGYLLDRRTIEGCDISELTITPKAFYPEDSVTLFRIFAELRNGTVAVHLHATDLMQTQVAIAVS